MKRTQEEPPARHIHCTYGYEWEIDLHKHRYGLFMAILGRETETGT